MFEIVLYFLGNRFGLLRFFYGMMTSDWERERVYFSVLDILFLGRLGLLFL